VLLSEARSKADEEQKKWEQESWNNQTHGDWEDIWGDQKGSEGNQTCPYTMPKTSPEARDAARVLILQARDANLGIDPSKILSLYRDQHVGLLDDFRHDSPWLSVDWFKNSPYSPIQIEQHHHAHQHGSMWRAAFEDLLSAELGKEQRAHEAWTGRLNNQRLYSSWAQAGMDWMLGLQCRGVLPPQLPQLYRLRSSGNDRMDRHMMDTIFRDLVQGKPNMWDGAPVMHDFERLAQEIATFDQDEIKAQSSEPETEADLYEAFLGKADHNQPKAAPATASVKAKKTEPVVQQAQPDISASKILSSLTTTERTTSPDGTVTTKVLMKKRFADGTEESTETVSTTHGQQQDAHVPKLELAKAVEGVKADAKSQKGWFWN